MSRLNRAFVVLFAVAFATLAGHAMACDTPVYRYAMYKWQPTPYEVYFFHNEPAADADQKLRDAIDAAMDPREVDEVTNLVYLSVDLKEDEELVGVPPDVKKTWTSKDDAAAPTYMIVSPQGLELYTGPLDVKELPAVIDSPVRRNVGKHLEDGKATVFLLLESGDEKADADAEATLKKIVADVAAGKLNLYAGPEDQFAPQELATDKEADKEDDAPKQEVAYLKVNRKDEAERWLVRQLMAVESDLGEFLDKPMVFAIYGRGRALPPFIAKGISSDNLQECVEFVTSACSCTVKEQNPGVDLLMKYDWEAASERLAEKFGAEEGNENQFAIDEFFPDLVIGGDGEMPKDAEPAEASASTKALIGLFVNSTKSLVVKTVKGELGDEKEWSRKIAQAIPDFELPQFPAASDLQSEVHIDEPTATVEDAGSGSGTSQSEEPDPPEINPPSHDKIAMRDEHDLSHGTASATSDHGESTASQTLMVSIGVGVGIVLLLLVGATLILYRGD